MGKNRKANGLKKSIRGVLMVGAMLLLGSLVHMLIHFSKDLEESASVIVGQAVLAVLALLGTGFHFYFGKQGNTEDE